MSWKDNRNKKKYQKKQTFPPCNWTPEQTEKIRELAKWFEHFEQTHSRIPTQDEINEFGKTQVNA